RHRAGRLAALADLDGRALPGALAPVSLRAVAAAARHRAPPVAGLADLDAAPGDRVVGAVPVGRASQPLRAVLRRVRQRGRRALVVLPVDDLAGVRRLHQCRARAPRRCARSRSLDVLTTLTRWRSVVVPWRVPRARQKKPAREPFPGWPAS